MPYETPLAAEGNPEALRHVENFHAPPEAIHPDVHAQLTNPQDIASANQFFKPTGAEQYLPTVGHVGPSGIEMTAAAPAGKFALPHMTGLETQGLQVMPPGGEMAALSGAPGAIPGAEPISPLINMIMKMPGHIGLVSSFFEALGAFLAPAGEMLGNLVGGLDASALFEHAGAASDAFAEALETAGEHVTVDLNLLPADAPIFDTVGHPGIGDFSLDATGPALGEGAPHLSDSFANAPRLEVGGSPHHTIFETGSGTNTLSFDAPNNNYLAMEPNKGFGSTVGNFNPPSTPPAQAVPQQTLTQPTGHTADPTTHATHSAPHTNSAAGPHHSSALDFRRDALSSSREHLLGGGETHHHPASHPGEGSAPEAHAAQPQAQAQGQSDVWAEQQATPQTDRVAEVQDAGKVSGESYTVHKGDNLWDIAHNHLGDGSRWHEIYDLNKSALGDNPRMIMPGTELQMPGGDAIANGGSAVDYTVKPGDNLWDISQQHMGGGQNWHELFQNNEAVVGSNPAMIHPGQHLHFDASAHGQQAIAGGDSISHGSGHHLASGHHSHHLASHSHSPSHSPSNGHNAGSHVASQVNPGNSVAHAGPAHDAAAGQHHAGAGNELKAQAQSISTIESYGDGSNHVVDSSAHVPNSQH